MQQIISLTNKDERFYSILGPFLSNREIVKELGSPVWDDDGKTWIVTLKEQAVIGFCAFTAPTSSGSVTFCSDYVLPDHRSNGVYELMFIYRMTKAEKYRKVAVATKASIKMFKKAGFRVLGNKGRYCSVVAERDYGN